MRRWTCGFLCVSGLAPPDLTDCKPLPGGGVGRPVLTSNNPEIFWGPGVLYTNSGPLSTRGGGRFDLSGDFGVYLHHINRAGTGACLSLLAQNPLRGQTVVNVTGSGFDQDDVGGMGIGNSPDFHVARDWLTDRSNISRTVTLVGNASSVLWQRCSRNNTELDGRFALSSSDALHVFVVASRSSSLADVLSQLKIEAPGEYLDSNPPATFGREAGVYEFDTWSSVVNVSAPSADDVFSYAINTATGAGFEQVQAFPALSHLTKSAAEAVGMYGNIYDITILVKNTAAQSRAVTLAFSSLSAAQISRLWDGVGLVDGELLPIQHVPGRAVTVLKEFVLLPLHSRTVHFKTVVPGLTSLPQALSVAFSNASTVLV
mmetsp:Transcript_56510/g.123861  ORF Transcript_56510/g.123861 Transcript_56510/m.123861 type:complete len:373 (+) Transcript_56510:37-1155(+)